MKRMFAVLLLCLAAVLPCFSAAAGFEPRLTLSADAQTVCAEQHFTVTLSLSDALPDVGSLEVHLYYNEASLRFVRAHAGTANNALRPILPDGGQAYTGVVFVYDYGQDCNADQAFSAGTLLTAEFAVRADAQADKLSFSVDCAAALDTAFRPLALMPDAALSVRLAHPQVAIRNYTPIRTVDYRTTLTLCAEAEADAVPGGTVCWIVNGEQTQNGSSVTLRQMRQDTVVQAVYCVDGMEAARSEAETIRVKNGFFDRLLAFFRGLFGTLQNIEQALF